MCVIVEGTKGQLTGLILHGPFNCEDAAIEWAYNNMGHSAWHCAPLHEPIEREF